MGHRRMEEGERGVKRYGVKGCGECCQCASVASFQCCQFPIVGCRGARGRAEAARVPLPRGAARWCARAGSPAFFCGGRLSTAAKMAAPHTAAPAGVSCLMPPGRSRVSGLMSARRFPPRQRRNGARGHSVQVKRRLRGSACFAILSAARRHRCFHGRGKEDQVPHHRDV